MFTDFSDVLALIAAADGNRPVPSLPTSAVVRHITEIVGTARSRVSFFMNRFRKLGFIEYNGTLRIHSSLLNVILHD
jgi:hypothetical protein